MVMRLLLIASTLLLAGACGAYSFPGQTPGVGAVTGKVLVYRCAPVEQEGKPCNGLTGAGLQVVFSSGSDVRSAAVDAGGRYTIELPAGTWKVSFKGIARIISGPPAVTVPAGGSVVADYVIDSGIRVPEPAPAGYGTRLISRSGTKMTFEGGLAPFKAALTLGSPSAAFST